MVHDVIHERYARHDNAFYEERERLARERLTGFHPDSETAFALTDDIAVGLDRRGRSEEAIALMRDKLKRQEALGLKGKELYSSYANLAELLLHGHFWGMMKGNAEDRLRVMESCDLIRKSMEVNPKAHFGREGWQLIAIESLLKFGLQPSLAKARDLIGNRLQVSYETWEIGEEMRPYDVFTRLRRPYSSGWATEKANPEFPLGDELMAERNGITEVGDERLHRGDDAHSFGKKAPFDEPALWLVGEWRQGSGPNPHYALSLGEIMLRVGQRYLAWNCFERATRMSEQFWPTADLQDVLKTHCRERQQLIEQSLEESESTMLRPNFDKELAFGLKYQKEYQAFTQEKIQAGKDLNDPHFFDEFHANRPPIASPVGSEEWYAGNTGSGGDPAGIRAFLKWGLFTGGACFLLSSLFISWIYRSRPSPLNLKEISVPKDDQLPQCLDSLRPDAADPS